MNDEIFYYNKCLQKLIKVILKSFFVLCFNISLLNWNIKYILSIFYIVKVKNNFQPLWQL